MKHVNYNNKEFMKHTRTFQTNNSDQNKYFSIGYLTRK